MKSFSVSYFAIFVICATEAFAQDGKAITARLYINPVTTYIYQGPGRAQEEVHTESKLEIVPYDRKALYFRTHLAGGNGSGCKFFGIAKKVDEFTYVYKQDQCELAISLDDAKNIVFHDQNSTCTSLACGAYTYLNGAKFGAAKSQPIRYLSRLKQSTEYRAAVLSYENGKPINETFDQEWHKDHPATPNDSAKQPPYQTPVGLKWSDVIKR